jgi:hypothetical protein
MKITRSKLKKLIAETIIEEGPLSQAAKVLRYSDPEMQANHHVTNILGNVVEKLRPQELLDLKDELSNLRSGEDVEIYSKLMEFAMQVTDDWSSIMEDVDALKEAAFQATQERLRRQQPPEAGSFADIKTTEF